MNPHAQNGKYAQFQGNALFVSPQKAFFVTLGEYTYSKTNVILFTCWIDRDVLANS